MKRHFGRIMESEHGLCLSRGLSPIRLKHDYQDGKNGAEMVFLSRGKSQSKQERIQTLLGTKPFTCNRGNIKTVITAKRYIIKWTLHVVSPVAIFDDFLLCPNEYELFLKNYPPKYVKESDGFSRLKSYGSVSPTVKGKRSSLIHSGFFYNRPEDVVTCFHCGGSLSSWADDDDPFVDHCRWFPMCTYTRFFAGDDAVNYIIEEHTKLMNKLEQEAHAETKPSDVAVVESLLGQDGIRFYEMTGIKQCVLSLAASLLPKPSTTVEELESKVADLCHLKLNRDWRTIPRNRETSFTRIIDLRVTHAYDGNTREGSSASSRQPVAPNAEYLSPPKYAEYSDFRKRLGTFDSFPHPSVVPLTHADLADAGLFYTGRDDETMCFHCGGKLRGWEPHDDPYKEHERWNPGCEFIQLKLCERSHANHSPQRQTTEVPHARTEGDEGYISMQIDRATAIGRTTISYHEPAAPGAVAGDEGYISMQIDRATAIDRATTSYREPAAPGAVAADNASCNGPQSHFRTPDEVGLGNTGFQNSETYVHGSMSFAVPHSRPAFPRYATSASREMSFDTYPTTAKVNKDKLTKAGFFYTGEQDRTTCFQCGNTLCSWDDGDEPLVEHARWFPNCAYVELALGDEAISNVRETHRNTLAEREALERSRSNKDTEFMLRELLRAPCVIRLLQQGIDRVIVKLAIRKRLNSASLIDVLDEQDLRKALAEVVALPENVRTKEVSKAETRNLSKCILCSVGDRNCMFLPCSHLIACTACAATCLACPTCNRKVITNMNVFLT